MREFKASEFTVEETAKRLNLPLDMLFKTLVAEGERKGLVMALVPGDAQLSLSKLAKAMGDKRAEMIDVDDLFRVTGYLKGGCSPLGAKRAFPVFMDEDALLHDRISVSAGLRGVQCCSRRRICSVLPTQRSLTLLCLHCNRSILDDAIHPDLQVICPVGVER